MQIQPVPAASPLIHDLRIFAEKTFRVAWQASNNPDDFEQYCREAFDPARFSSEFEQPGAEFYQAIEQGGIVGYLKLNINRTPENRSGETALQIERIYVIEGRQDAGVGRNLMDFAEQRAKETGAAWIWLSVWKKAPRSIAFYHKRGYEIFGEEVFYVGTDAQMDWLMRKKTGENTPPVPFLYPAISLLKALISIPSFSREESGTADAIAHFLQEQDIPVHRVLNNVYAFNAHFAPEKPVFLLNSHHDTVKPNTSYTRDPFSPDAENGRLYGLGSNDAGGPLVSLIAVFLYFYPHTNLPFNLCLAATAEEECSGKNGIEQVLPLIPNLQLAIVGEPTQMHLAVAEKGLMVLDCTAHGKAGHAARDEGDNAIYRALRDIEWFRTFEFPKISEFLGKVKMSVTMIEAGQQHNVVPDRCRFTVDVRVTDAYTLEEILDIIRENVQCEVVPRSVRLRSSAIALDHPIVLAGKALGRKCYGSPTLSDQALITSCPSVKIGPGDSARSHTADEYIEIAEIAEGIELYIKMLSH